MSASASSQVGFLVPLNNNLEEEDESSIPKVSLSEGPNVVGRDCIPITDKRLSRKHLTVHAAASGSAEVFVVGTNPVVIRTKDERKKLLSGQKWKIEDGDIIELIPGHYFFKHVTLAGGEDQNSRISRQKRHLDEVSASCSKDQSFGRKKTRDISEEEALAKLSQERRKPASWILHKPPLPISYGTHHSKAMLLVYPQRVRVIVHTANLIPVDWNNKNQGLWMQDFPWKDQKSSSKGCDFENDLADYLSTLKRPEFCADLQAFGRFSINPIFFKKFDYNSSAVRLIASVPGYHMGANLKKWGHMKMCSVLQECTFYKQCHKSPLIYQFSSLGSLDEKWMAEFASSMCAGVSEDKKALGTAEPLIIWPTVEDVRCSLEGYAAGNSIPSPVKNVEKAFLKKYWAKWKASQTGRSNLSKAAWGTLQKNNSQLMIRSYELGVLFLPSPIKPGSEFSCTSGASINDICGIQESSSEVKKTKIVTLAWQGNKTAESTKTEVIQLPVPYELPPLPYSPEDVPWSWDIQRRMSMAKFGLDK